MRASLAPPRAPRLNPGGVTDRNERATDYVLVMFTGKHEVRGAE